MRYLLILVFGLVLQITTVLLTFFQVEPFYTLNVAIALWSVVLVAGAANQFYFSNSIAFANRWSLFYLASLSVVFWLMFELFNLHLGNWRYIGIPLERIIRWPAYLFTFSPILPALLELFQFLRNNGVGDRLRAARKVRVNRALLFRFILLGSCAAILALVGPGIFYPLIWLGPVFILDPLIYQFGNKEDSLLGNLELGRPALWVQLSLTGLIFGVLTQFWSFWSGSKWLYSVPGYEFFYIFELPVLGYLVFPFLALSFYVMYCLAKLFSEKRWLAGRGRKILIGLLLFLYVEGVIWGIDEYTVLTFRVIF